MKYKAIEEYLASGDQSDSFSEVITFKEVREILRNWDTLRFKNGDPVVQFVRKGRIMSKTAAEEFVKGYQQRMADANKEAGRRPAPGRVEKADPNDPNKTIRVLAFEKELAAIDPGLPAKLDAKLAAGADEAEIDKDARDIVRKAGYLQRVSKTNPEFTLKYIMSKCQVLIDYDLIANGLVDAAADFAKRAYAHPPADKDALKAPANTLKAEVKKCGVAFRVPLAESLIKHHNMKHSKRLKNIVKDG